LRALAERPETNGQLERRGNGRDDADEVLASDGVSRLIGAQGELGDGTTNYWSKPTPVSALRDAVEVAAGGHPIHSVLSLVCG
jgi:hypothetical protein